MNRTPYAILLGAHGPLKRDFRIFVGGDCGEL
jgi:hypothetical protein